MIKFLQPFNKYSIRIQTADGKSSSIVFKMPEEGSENREYQGPAHFKLNGKTLDEIRKERETKKKLNHG